MSVDEAKYPMSDEFVIERNASASAHPSVEKKGLLGLDFYAVVALSKTATAPIDRVKLLWQNQIGLVRDGTLPKAYTGFRNCFWRTMMDEGFASLWRGNVANLIRYVPAQAITFGMWDAYKPKCRDGFGYISWFLGNFNAGCLAGGSSALVVYPMDYARTRLAVDAKKGGERQFKGLVDLCRKTLAAEGIVGFYRGFGLSFVGACGYRGIYFATYECIKPVKQESFFGSFMLAWETAIFTNYVMHPIDMIRRRMMVMPTRASISTASWQIKDTTGLVNSAFRGVRANIPRSIVGAAMLVAYDTKPNFLFT